MQTQQGQCEQLLGAKVVRGHDRRRAAVRTGSEQFERAALQGAGRGLGAEARHAATIWGGVCPVYPAEPPVAPG